MPECPFCHEEQEDLEKLSLHLLSDHPEKTASAEAYGMVQLKVRFRSLVYELAAVLTQTSFGTLGADKEKVLGRFQYFVTELSKVIGFG